MRVNERDFSTYHLGDDVTQLAGGVIAEVADITAMPLDGSNVEQLGMLVGAIGADKVLRNNPNRTLQDALPLERAADLIDQSGIQKPLNRSFRHPDTEMPFSEPLVVTGAVANWQDRTAKLVQGWPQTRVFMPTGNRDMSSKTEISNPNIIQFMRFDIDQPYPTEARYAESYVKPLLERAGHDVRLEAIESGDGQFILDSFAKSHRDLLYGRIGVARVANAGVQLAYQMRQAARGVLPQFDSDKQISQLYIITDTLPVARTEEQVKDLTNFQSPYTALRQLALTAKLLAQAGFEN